MKSFPRSISGFICFLFVMMLLPFTMTRAQDYVKSDFMVSDITGFSYQAVQLSVGNQGEMAVVWETSGTGDIWLRTISSKGEVLSGLISVEAPFSTMETRVAHNDIGNFMVMFGALLGNWSLMGQTFSPAGDPIGDTLMVDRNTTEMIDVFKSSLRANQINQFGAFLPGHDSMIVEMLSENGEFLSSTIVLKPDAQNFPEMKGQMTYKGDNHQ